MSREGSSSGLSRGDAGIFDRSQHEWTLLAYSNVVDELIDRVASNTATTNENQFFQQEALRNNSFRRLVKESKDKYRLQGEREKADRLNGALIMMIHNTIARPTEMEIDASDISDDMAAEAQEEANLFYDVADGTASPEQKQDFLDRLLNDRDFHRRVSNFKNLWSSMASESAQQKAARLKDGLELSDKMRAEDIDAAVLDNLLATAEGPERAASGESAPRQTAPQESRQAKRRQGRSKAAAEQGALLATGGKDIIEAVASRVADANDLESFKRRMRSDPNFQNQVKQRDLEYRQLGTTAGYLKAQELRLVVARHVNVALGMLFPSDPLMDEAFIQIQDERGEHDTEELYKTEYRQWIASRIGEAKGQRSRGRGRGGSRSARRGDPTRGRSPLDMSSETAAAGSERAAEDRTPQHFIVSSQAMEELHSKLRNSRVTEPTRGRTRASGDPTRRGADKPKR
jgi:hypothetical protein